MDEFDGRNSVAFWRDIRVRGTECGYRSVYGRGSRVIVEVGPGGRGRFLFRDIKSSSRGPLGDSCSSLCQAIWMFLLPPRLLRILISTE